MSTVRENKENRLSIRIDSHQKAIIMRAAQIKHKSISDFVLENAYEAASNILADDVYITMSKEEFEEFTQILDNPPQKNVEAFMRMMSKPSVLNDK